MIAALTHGERHVVCLQVRDISASMWGMHSKWTSSVILRLIELTRRQSMRLGYIEFNEHSWKYRAAADKGGHFFVKDYEKVPTSAALFVDSWSFLCLCCLWCLCCCWW